MLQSHVPSCVDEQCRVLVLRLLFDHSGWASAPGRASPSAWWVCISSSRVTLPTERALQTHTRASVMALWTELLKPRLFRSVLLEPGGTQEQRSPQRSRSLARRGRAGSDDCTRFSESTQLGAGRWEGEGAEFLFTRPPWLLRLHVASDATSDDTPLNLRPPPPQKTGFTSSWTERPSELFNLVWQKKVGGGSQVGSVGTLKLQVDPEKIVEPKQPSVRVLHSPISLYGAQIPSHLQAQVQFEFSKEANWQQEKEQLAPTFSLRTRCTMFWKAQISAP